MIGLYTKGWNFNTKACGYRVSTVWRQEIHHLQAKEYLRPPEARKETWDGFPSAALGRDQHCDNLGFELTVPPLWDITFLLCEPSNLWYLIISAPRLLESLSIFLFEEYLKFKKQNLPNEHVQQKFHSNSHYNLINPFQIFNWTY